MFRQAQRVVFVFAVVMAAGCADVLPMEPLEEEDAEEVDEEKEKLRELVEKVKARVREEEERRNEVADEIAMVELEEEEGGTSPDLAAVIAVRRDPSRELQAAPHVEVVRCAPQMGTERGRGVRMVVLVADGRARRVEPE